MKIMHDEDYDWKEHTSSWSDVLALAAIAAAISIVSVAIKWLAM